MLVMLTSESKTLWRTGHLFQVGVLSGPARKTAANQEKHQPIEKTVETFGESAESC
jgi:hypothetical protein